MEKTGTVLSVTGGIYEVYTAEGELLRCPAKGAFRHTGTKPLPGDAAVVRDGESGDCLLVSLGARRNTLSRPPLANVGVLFILIAAAKPDPILLTVDKLTVSCERCGIEPVIVITKTDLAPEKAEELASVYRRAGYAVFCTGGRGEDGGSALREFLVGRIEGKVAAFCGASGVGKSTLLQAVFPTLTLASGELARKTDRGKQTTRVTRLFPLSSLVGEGHTGFIADTPGFSMLDLPDGGELAPSELIGFFRELAPLAPLCRWQDCRHKKEDGCAILAAVEEGTIAPSRHENYIRLFEEARTSSREWKKRPSTEK